MPASLACGESGTNQVHIIRTDGTGGRQLTFPPLRPGGAGPSWSPDGTQIMFSDFDSTRPIQWQGYIMDANGSDVHKLPTGGGSYGPRWCAPKKM
jgi:Tol biopolymer transport system component